MTRWVSGPALAAASRAPTRWPRARGDALGGGPLGDPGDLAAWDGFGVGVSAPHAARNSATPPASDAPRNRRRVMVPAERPA